VHYGCVRLHISSCALEFFVEVDNKARMWASKLGANVRYYAARNRTSMEQIGEPVWTASVTVVDCAAAI
jgi:hypothetical protein